MLVDRALRSAHPGGVGWLPPRAHAHLARLVECLTVGALRHAPPVLVEYLPGRTGRRSRGTIRWVEVTEGPRGLPAVRLLEFEFPTGARAGAAQRMVRVALGRVDELSIFLQPNDELVIGIWLTRIFNLRPKIDVPEVVRLGRTTDLTGPRRVALAARAAGEWVPGFADAMTTSGTP